MTIPQSGKIYNFQCVGTSRYLNLHTTGATSNGINVCLWTKDGTAEQQWKFEGSVLKPMTNTSFALDRLVNKGKSNDNNADIWKPDLANQRVEFIDRGSHKVRIKLKGDNVYLSAYNNANGTGTGKTQTSTGNVFFAPLGKSQYQEWEFTEVKVDNGDSGSGSGNGTIIKGQRPSTLNYNGSAYRGPFNKFNRAQCTWHCFGRAKEVLGETIKFDRTGGLNGGAWWTRVKGYDKDKTTPKANSIAVWVKLLPNGTEPVGPEVAGHVAYVEKVYGDYVYLSEANYGDESTIDVFDDTDGTVRVATRSGMKTRCNSKYSTFTFKGYIYL